MSIVVLYDANNSGGNWWLEDSDWDALAEKGWTVHWCIDGSRPHGFYLSKGDSAKVLVDQSRFPKAGDRWLGALACSCAKEFSSVEEGVKEWEEITKQNAASIGCTCCGPPHEFEWYDENNEHHYVGLSYVGTLNF